MRLTLCGNFPTVSGYGSSPVAVGQRPLQDRSFYSPNLLRCDTLPLFTGGLRGSFRFSTLRTSNAQRFSSTAVYPSCPCSSQVKERLASKGMTDKLLHVSWFAYHFIFYNRTNSYGRAE